MLEREFAGFGASGRNGGWLSSDMDWPRETYLKTSSREAIRDFDRALAATVDEVIAVAQAEGIDADIRRVDELHVAVNPPQLDRARAKYEEARRWDAAPERIEMLGAAEARARVRIPNILGAVLIRGGARVQPAKLVRGLATAVERLSVVIHERTEVTSIAPGRAATRQGTVRAPIIIRATEGFTPGLPGYERAILPLNSAIIATETLPPSLWDEIGWQGHELLCNTAHTFFYAQRTREGRIAIGGRGTPYRFGSATDRRGRTDPATIALLRRILAGLLPQAAGLKIDHAWCGVLGVPRDWCAGVAYDPGIGIGWAGGYVGMGVTSSNLAGRTLCDLILRRDPALTRLPWVNRPVRRWEPEPLRWLGVHAISRLYRMADASEAAGLAHMSGFARLANRIRGD